MLYIFAGFPGKQLPIGTSSLNVGGLQVCIEEVEWLGLVEHEPTVQFRKEDGLLVYGNEETGGRGHDYHISDQCLRDGITWDWFPENWAFGNGVTFHTTSASLDYKTVVHGTDLDLDKYLAMYGTMRLADIELERRHIRHESWKKYEARWLPGTCPQENHIVHLTWVAMGHRLPTFAYERLRQIIEDAAQPMFPERYNSEKDKHFSASSEYDGRPALVRR